MRKILTQLLVITIIIQLFAVLAWTQEANAADGTSSDPHIIMDEDDLSNIRLDLAAYYELGANIDLSGYDYDGDGGGWMPIGPVFSGSLDGNGYTISNMRIDRPVMEEVGLFSSMYSSAKLIDIRLLDIEVVGAGSAGGLVGALVESTIENSYATGSVHVSGIMAGGLVGANAAGIIKNSYAVVDVSGGDVIGGLVGWSTGTIRNAYAAGSVSGFNQAGGLVAHTSGGEISNSYALGKVSGEIDSDIGGLVGINRFSSPSTVTESYWNKDTTGQAGSDGGMGKTSEEMKNMASLGWDSSVWGFIEGATYPYLRTFGMGIGVDPLAVSTYSLKPGQDAVSVTGSVYHESAMEPIDVQYIIRDSAGDVISNNSYPTLGSEAVRPINRRFSLTGYANGGYTLTVKATDSHRTAVGITLAFVVNNYLAAPPTVHFTDNDEAWVQSAETTVTLSNSGGGINTSTAQYSWSTDSATPGPGAGWTSFASGNTLSKSGVIEEVYLHVRVEDNSGVTANVVSNRFRLDNAAPTINFSTNGSETLAQSASTTVTVTDATAGVDASSLQYAWTDDTATPTSWTTFASGDPLSISAVNGDRYLHIEATDAAGNPASVVSNRFRLDNAAPEINFSTNGSETLAQSASTMVTVTDAGAGVDASSLQYAWTPDTATPTSWTSFTSGDSLSISAVNGDRYLHIVASDTLGNSTNGVSNRFRLRLRLRATPSNTTNQTVPSSVIEAPKSVIDVNGVALDPASIDIKKPSATLDVTPKAGVAYVSIPAHILLDFAGHNTSFFIEIKTPYGGYQVPVNLAALIPGLNDLLAASNLKPEDISFKITLNDKSDDKDIQKAFRDNLIKGSVIGAIVDFQMEVMNTKTRQIIGTVDQFNKALTRVIPMPKSMTSMPEQWGAFRYNESTKKFGFVPAQGVQIDGVWYVMIRSYTNSIYAVAHNPVSFSDTLKHWGKSYVELSAAKGLIEGVGGDRFEPDRSITRAEFTAILIRALGYGESAVTSSPYNDVKLGSWYLDIVAKAKQLGLLDFVEGNSFKPDQSLTREEMASLLEAVIAHEKLPMTKELVSLDSYTDVDNVNAAYLEDVRTMVKLNIMTGTGSNAFSPKGESTRAQAGVVLIKTLKALRMID